MPFSRNRSAYSQRMADLEAENRELRTTILRVKAFVDELNDALDLPLPRDYAERRLVEHIVGDLRAALEGGV